MLNYFLAIDCKEWLEAGYNCSGWYRVTIAMDSCIVCDMETNGGGWFVVQRRFDETANFYITSTSSFKFNYGLYSDDYEQYWFGFYFIKGMVDQAPSSLLIRLRLANQEIKYAMYDSFSLGPHPTYTLNVWMAFSGTAGDSLSQLNGTMFSSFNDDNDGNDTVHCAELRKGGWWYPSDCNSLSNLNGIYHTPGTENLDGMYWWTATDGPISLQSSEMMVRRND